MNWYETAFRSEYLDLYYHRDDEAARDEAAFAAKAMGLRADSLVLDVACGAGRHVRALAELGHRAIGVDLSADLLARAEDAVRVFADMRSLPFRGVTTSVIIARPPFSEKAHPEPPWSTTRTRSVLSAPSPVLCSPRTRERPDR